MNISPPSNKGLTGCQVRPALLMSFARAAGGLVRLDGQPDWSKAIADGSRTFVELLQQCAAARAEKAE